MSGDAALTNPASGTPATSGTPSGSASGAVSGAANASSGPSKSNTPQPGASNAIPIRDKDSLSRILVERYQTHDWVNQDRLVQFETKTDRYTRERRTGSMTT